MKFRNPFRKQPADPADEELPSLIRIVRLFRPYRLSVAALVLTVLGQSAATVCSPFLLRAILDRALPERNMELLTLLALGMGAAAVIAAVLTMVSNWLSMTIGQSIMHDVRTAVYAHMQRMSFAYFTHAATGDIQSTIANDIGGVNSVVTTTAGSAVQSIATIGAVTVSIYLLDWQLAILASVIVPVFFLLTFRVGRQRRRLVAGRQRRMRNLTALIEESMSVAGALLIKTMARQGTMLQRFTNESRQISTLEVQASLAGKWRIASRRMSMTVIPAAIYWVAGEEFAHGGSVVSIGTVVAFTSMLNRVIGPANDLQGLSLDVSTSLAIFARIFKVLDQPVDFEESPGARPLVVTEGTVTLDAVSFRYDKAGPWTVKDVSIDIPGGKRAAIVGPTGAGKTTLAYLTARLYEPDRGVIRIDGMDLRDATFESVAKSIGFVSQETYLFHTTIAENLRFAKPDATDPELEEAARTARIHSLIASLPEGYQTRTGARGYRFSGGERQRLAIARLLLRDTKIIILDEATSALDTRTELAIQDALESLSRGRTTITIAHRLSTITDADQILVLDHGQIVERGTHAELMALAGQYADLVDASAARSAASDYPDSRGDQKPRSWPA